jgi:hypothetical protein
MNVHVKGVAMAETESLEDAARRVAAALRSGELSIDAARALMTAGVVAFGARRDQGDRTSPLSPGHDATATDVAVTCTAMLEDVNIAIFELGLWQSMAGGKS